MSPAISKRSASALLKIVENLVGTHDAAVRRAAEELRHSLRVRPGLKLAKTRRANKKRAKTVETRSIRAEVMARADGVCECGCRTVFSALAPAEMDHFLPKGRYPQTVETCWLIRADCHRAKHKSQPSPEYWLQKFLKHCEKHGLHSAFRIAATRLGALEMQAGIGQ